MEQLEATLSKFTEKKQQFDALVVFLLLLLTKDEINCKILQELLSSESNNYPTIFASTSESSVKAGESSVAVGVPSVAIGRPSSRFVDLDNNNVAPKMPNELNDALSLHFEELKAHAIQFVVHIYNAYYVGYTGALSFFEFAIVHIYTREPTYFENPFYGLNFYELINTIAKKTKCKFICGEPMDDLPPIDYLYYCMFLLALAKIPDSPVSTLYRAVNFNSSFTLDTLLALIESNTICGTFVSTTSMFATLGEFSSGASGAILAFEGAIAKDLSSVSQFANESEMLIPSAIMDTPLKSSATIRDTVYAQVSIRGGAKPNDGACNQRMCALAVSAADIVFNTPYKEYDDQLAAIRRLPGIIKSKPGMIIDSKIKYYTGLTPNHKAIEEVFKTSIFLSKKPNMYPKQLVFITGGSTGYNCDVHEIAIDPYARRLSLSFDSPLIVGPVCFSIIIAVSITVECENELGSKNFDISISFYQSDSEIFTMNFIATIDDGIKTRLFIAYVEKNIPRCFDSVHAIEVRATPSDNGIITISNIGMAIKNVFFRIRTRS